MSSARPSVVPVDGGYIMARSLVRGLSGFFAVVLLVCGSFWWADQARAAEPVPGPVDEILDVPSRALRSASGSPMGDSVLVDMWRIMTGATKGTVATPPVSIASVPKPITPLQVASRTGGTAMLAPMIGWAMSANGTLALMGAATGTGYESTFCAQPGWYQGVTAFVNLSFAPDCSTLFLDPNVDITPGLTPLVYAGSTITHVTTVSYSDSGGTVAVHCYSGWPVPAGTQVQNGNGSWTSVSGMYAWGPSGCGSNLFLWGKILSPPAQVTSQNPGRPVGPALRVVVGGSVVAQMATRSENPTRTPRCTVTGDGSSVTRNGTPYTEDDGIPFSAEGLGCKQAYEDFTSAPGRGPGFLPDTIGVESVESESGAITEISEQDVPDFTESERKGLTVGNGRGLVLEKLVGTSWDSCMTWAADCVGWWESTDNGTTPGTYRCTYAGEAIDLLECGPYRHTFDEQTSTPTITDPATGEEVAWSGQPNTSNSINPGVGPGTGLTPSESCYASGWASVANPLDWVLVPVKCALVWAFVPRQTVVDATGTRVSDAWEDTMPGKLPALVAGLIIPPAGDSGCMGPHVDFSLSLPGFGGPIVLDVDQYPLAACTEPMASVATAARVFGAAILLFFTGMGIIRRASAVVNAPGVGASGGPA